MEPSRSRQPDAFEMSFTSSVLVENPSNRQDNCQKLSIVTFRINQISSMKDATAASLDVDPATNVLGWLIAKTELPVIEFMFRKAEISSRCVGDFEEENIPYGEVEAEIASDWSRSKAFLLITADASIPRASPSERELSLIASLAKACDHGRFRGLTLFQPTLIGPP
ncbi:hypothetical protein EYR41_010974 [Orbilia oligospora]|uniref:Uncharacterized protein n=1 Tax=Orbilia oligospora TaxID=2813651 RepID=A0A8H2DQZ7_ORBOL|nr:hypothetical protein EYR41_010974 [Orbilia oligospora]